MVIPAILKGQTGNYKDKSLKKFVNCEARSNPNALV